MMQRSAKLLRKIGVALVGFPLLVLGAILVPLPGPGFLVMFVALLLLSTEFEWSKKYVDKARAKFKDIMRNAQEKSDRIAERADKK